MRTTNSTRRVMIVGDDPRRAERVKEALEEEGVEVLSVIGNTATLLYQIEQQRPDVVLIDLNAPGCDVLESLAVVNEHNPVTMVMFSRKDDPDYIQQAIDAGINTYLVQSVDPDKVRPVIDVALAQFNLFQSLRDELEETRSALLDQKAIARAKALLIKDKGLSEDAAHKMLTRMAMEHNLTLGGLAQSVLSTLDCEQ